MEGGKALNSKLYMKFVNVKNFGELSSQQKQLSPKIKNMVGLYSKGRKKFIHIDKTSKVSKLISKKKHLSSKVPDIDLE